MQILLEKKENIKKKNGFAGSSRVGFIALFHYKYHFGTRFQSACLLLAQADSVSSQAANREVLFRSTKSTLPFEKSR